MTTATTRSAVLAFIRQSLRRGAPPSVREIAKACGLRSTATAFYHIERLRDEGFLAPARHGQNRDIRLADKPGCCAACGQAIPESDTATPAAS